MCVAYLLSTWSARHVDARWIIGALLAVQVILFLAPPLQYTDVFNYINYARMGVVHHLNPYTTLPFHGPHTDPAYAISNWHHLLTPYGPLFLKLGSWIVTIRKERPFSSPIDRQKNMRCRFAKIQKCTDLTRKGGMTFTEFANPRAKRGIVSGILEEPHQPNAPTILSRCQRQNRRILARSSRMYLG